MSVQGAAARTGLVARIEKAALVTRFVDDLAADALAGPKKKLI
jgi:hypothetical protein